LEGRRAPQGLAAEDRLAFGLTASHLSYLVIGSLTGYAILASGLPGPLDLSSEIDELTTYALEAAHQVYYVMTPTASGVQDTYRGVETLRRLGHRRKLRFVLNQQRAGFSPDEMLGDLGGTLSASIPRDDAFSAAEDDHEPVSLRGAGAAAKAIGAFAASIYPSLDSAPARAGFWARLRSRLG
jgi:MinD-like ATPase involved in chromosome partitioning or flagellar assembly